ncbi:hypothetical protein [Romboutsia lituseburensis]|uniref:hypothetical protein n=1 Tax=Romboutsia lituseburensis TaxID=1537 RepID=UPI0022EB653E|nr:hypothetical protein [Romboutsia lituseburensis]
MSINIGDNNEIIKSNIIDNSNISNKDENDKKESFASKHPIFIGVIGSILASMIMMFPFWDNISQFIKNLF